jgi:flagellar hook-associated protein FlgK
MPALSSISLIGISAANYALNGSAHNIANHSTPGFRRQLVSQSTGANGGVNSQASLVIAG